MLSLSRTDLGRKIIWLSFLMLLVLVAVSQSPMSTKHGGLRGHAAHPLSVGVTQSSLSTETLPGSVSLFALALSAIVVTVTVAGLSQARKAPKGAQTCFGDRADDWGVTFDDIKKAEARVSSYLGKGALDGPLATFLLAKGVTEDDARRGLDRAVQKLQGSAEPGSAVPKMPFVSQHFSWPYLHWFLSSADPIALAMRDRSYRLLNFGDTPLPSSTGGAAALATFIAANPLWIGPAAYISLHHQKLAPAVISRVQRSGVCFLHAVLVGLHYLLNFHGDAPQASIADITCFLRRNLTDGSLSRFLFADDGGYTEEIIKQFFVPAAGTTVLDTLESGNDDTDFAAMRHRLETHAVGFVCSFDIEPAFKLSSTSHFVMSQTGALPQDVERHAMLLVGVRFDAARNEYVMLLQNWWEAKEYVEVGQGYWKACNARLLFVRTPQTSMPPGLRMVQYTHAAAGVVGAGVLGPRLTR